MYGLICSYFHGHCSPASFIVFDAMNRHQRVPDDKPICPFLPCPGFHPLCPHYFVWVPGSNSQQRHIANTFFFVSIIGSPDSSRGATGQWVQISWPQALGHFAFCRPTGVYDLFWMLPWQLAYSAGVFSRWCFFKHDLTFFFSFSTAFVLQTESEWGNCLSFSWLTPRPVHLQSFTNTCFYTDVNSSP